MTYIEVQQVKKMFLLYSTQVLIYSWYGWPLIMLPFDRAPSASLEKAMAPHSSTLAWKIPWMEEPGRLQFMGSLRVRHDLVTSISLFTFMHWRRKWQPTPVLCLENPRDGGAWWAAISGVSQSQTLLKRLSSSSSSSSFIGGTGSL